jgi:demethylmenaquinone methyltransferase/2-methoxy-6-polyprenyl-1,4-benzoquinol methylase
MPSGDRYRIMGHIYELLANLYSGWRIAHCKEAMLGYIKPDDDVLFAGVGHGREAKKAAEQGARVTVVDLSQTMLDKCKNTLEGCNFNHPVQHVHDDIFNVSPVHKQYDYVFANFFLNVFKREKMDQVVQHLSKLAKPGGYVVVGDFAFPHGNILARALKHLYWYVAVTLFFLVTRNAFHDVYNYPEYLKKHGLQIAGIKYFKVLGLRLYWSVLAQKSS